MSTLQAISCHISSQKPRFPLQESERNGLDQIAQALSKAILKNFVEQWRELSDGCTPFKATVSVPSRSGKGLYSRVLRELKLDPIASVRAVYQPGGGQACQELAEVRYAYLVHQVKVAIGERIRNLDMQRGLSIGVKVRKREPYWWGWVVSKEPDAHFAKTDFGIELTGQMDISGTNTFDRFWRPLGEAINQPGT